MVNVDAGPQVLLPRKQVPGQVALHEDVGVHDRRAALRSSARSATQPSFELGRDDQCALERCLGEGQRTSEGAGGDVPKGVGKLGKLTVVDAGAVREVVHRDLPTGGGDAEDDDPDAVDEEEVDIDDAPAAQVPVTNEREGVVADLDDGGFSFEDGSPSDLPSVRIHPWWDGAGVAE